MLICSSNPCSRKYYMWLDSLSFSSLSFYFFSKIVMKPMEEIVVPNSRTTQCSKPGSLQRKVRSQKEQVLNCPRCNSTNTKFCYYNNYSLSQPRQFCKTCKRYWTEGGILKNIPIGGGSRKNKRSSSSSSSSKVPLSKKLPNLIPICFS